MQGAGWGEDCLLVSCRSKEMAVVRVLTANSESAVVDSHEEHDLPVLEVSLMMSESVSKVPDVLMTVGGRQD